MPNQAPIVASTSDVIKAIQAFPTGSAGGPNGLCPQLLKDLLLVSPGAGSSLLIKSLTTFINLVISGGVLAATSPYFFGATLITLNKKDGGVRPITIGCTLCRLAAKCVGTSTSAPMGALLAPIQLGYSMDLICITSSLAI